MFCVSIYINKFNNKYSIARHIKYKSLLFQQNNLSSQLQQNKNKYYCSNAIYNLRIVYCVFAGLYDDLYDDNDIFPDVFLLIGIDTLETTFRKAIENSIGFS